MLRLQTFLIHWIPDLSNRLLAQEVSSGSDNISVFGHMRKQVPEQLPGSVGWAKQKLVQMPSETRKGVGPLQLVGMAAVDGNVVDVGVHRQNKHGK